MTDTPYQEYPEAPQDPYKENYSEEDLDTYQGNNGSSSESLVNKSTIENFYATEDILHRIEKSARGYQIRDGDWVKVSEPIARDEFIDMMMNSLRSIINPNFILSQLTEDEIKEILMEKNEEFIDACNDEPTLDEDNVEYAINLHDIPLQIFLGQVKDGHGSKVLRQISGQLYVKDDAGKKNGGGFGDVFSQLTGGNRR